MYKHLDKLNVKSNLPTNQITQYSSKKFRTSSDICKYSCTLEESVLKESEEQNNRRTSILSDRRKSSVRNEDIMKSLAELRDEFKPETTSEREERTSSITGSVVNSTVLRMKAETAAELYLGTDDTSLFLQFLDFYVELMESLNKSGLETSNITDEKMVKVFNLFTGDVKKSSEFLVTAVELEELGFEEDKVVSALMLFSNDREAALDFLMKN